MEYVQLKKHTSLYDIAPADKLDMYDRLYTAWHVLSGHGCEREEADVANALIDFKYINDGIHFLSPGPQGIYLKQVKSICHALRVAADWVADKQAGGYDVKAFALAFFFSGNAAGKELVIPFDEKSVEDFREKLGTYAEKLSRMLQKYNYN